MSRIVPCLWYDGEAEVAARFYVSLLANSRIDRVVTGPTDTPGGRTGQTMAVEFTLAGASCLAINGGPTHRFTPAVSMMVHCDDQDEIDRLRTALGDGGSYRQCGWLEDRWGLSWQVVPKNLGEMLNDPDADRRRRVMEALLGMTKLDIARLEHARAGAPSK